MQKMCVPWWGVAPPEGEDKNLKVGDNRVIWVVRSTEGGLVGGPVAIEGGPLET